MKKEDILQDAENENVKYIRLCFTDIHGLNKNVEVPVRGLGNALDNEVMIDASSIDGFSTIEEADMYLWPDYETWLVLPWENTEYGKVARLICDVHWPNGEPFEGDPRAVLKRNLKALQKAGFSDMRVGVEPEFFLLKMDADGEITTQSHDRGGYFDLSPTDAAEDCRRDIVLELEKLGFDMEASHHEAAPGQHEINFRFEHALEACDKLQTFKLVVRNVAKRHGLYATFMPKLIVGENGSAMHTNCSLVDEDGNNVFYDPEGKLKLSETCYKWMAGILRHARGATAVTNPIVNSYKRLVPGYEAPCYVSWSGSNRSSLIRIPASRGAGTRTEVRSVDPAANPYLALSVILASGLDGIENDLEAPEPAHLNLYEMAREKREKMGILNLPENLKDALKALSRDEVLKKALGKHVYEKFMQVKNDEWMRYRSHISDWEIKTYLRSL